MYLDKVHSDGIPERIFRKSWFWKTISRRKKSMEKLPSRHTRQRVNDVLILISGDNLLFVTIS